VSTEYLMWWFKTGPVPPLVSGGSTGVLGTAGTTSIINNLGFDDQFHSGGRFNAGWRFANLPNLGVEGNFLFLENRTSTTVVSSPGSPILGTPFVNATTGAEDALLIASPGAGGSAAVSTSTRLWGAEGNLAAGLLHGDHCSVALLAGFRYLHLGEDLDMSIRSTSGLPLPGVGIAAIADHFGTRNDFYGGQLGTEVGAQWGRFFATLRAKVALGDSHETADVAGLTVLPIGSGQTTVFPGGRFALPTNSGHFGRDDLAFVPEVGLNVGCDLTQHLRAFAGYTFLYWDGVARPGSQIDRSVNPSQIPTGTAAATLTGPARPAFVFHDTDFWAQGINLGLEFHY
jgi:hypothetical protein